MKDRRRSVSKRVLGQSPVRRCRSSGMNLMELLAVLAIIGGFLFGALIGAEYGIIWCLVGMIAGSFAAFFGIVLLVFILDSPFMLFRLVKRLREPAVTVCTCGRSANGGGSEAGTLRADEDGPTATRRLSELEGYSPSPTGASVKTEDLRSRLKAGTLSEERVALAACLGHEAASALGVGTCEEKLQYSHRAKFPKDMRRVLRSGLPPRLIVAWTLACAERALAVFDAEYHQNKIPGTAFDSAVIVLLENNRDAAAVCKETTSNYYLAKRDGCRVVERDFWDRFWGRTSPGQHAAQAVLIGARGAATFCEPSGLWAVYSYGDIAGAYATPQNRCDWAQPCWYAESTAWYAALAGEDQEAEYTWQRELLADMILRWETWDADREAWRRRVEDEWIPRVLSDLHKVRFNVAKFAKRIRQELVPWDMG